MKISIIIPIYNVEKYIGICLDSILKHNSSETLSNVEIIGIDDVTPDNSAKIFKEYITEFPECNISLITHEYNKGLGGAKNTGINASNGDYLLFVDSDDWLSEGALDYLVTQLKDFAEDTILSFGFEAKKNGDVIWDYIPNNKQLLSSKEALNLFAQGSILPSAWNKIYPSKIFKQINFKEHLYYEDLEFTPRAIILSEKFFSNPKVLYNNRLDGNSITRQKTKKKHVEDLFLVLSSLKENIEDITVFSTIFCDRWHYLLKTWDLNNNLKAFALEKILLTLKNNELKFNHEKAINLSVFLEKEFHTSTYDISFKNQKKEILSILNSKLIAKDLKHINHIFEHVYIVNLEEAQEDKFCISKQMIDHDIDFEIWPASNGYSDVNRKKFEDYINRGIGNFQFFHKYEELEKYRGSKFIESPGAYGYIQTYISILEDAKKNNYQSILILEDDVILANDFDVKLETFWKEVKLDWKIVQLGASEYNWSNINIKQSINKGYYHPKAIETCGSFAIAINNSVYDELIEAQSYFDGPFDHIPLASLYEKYNKQCYVSFPNIIVPDVTTSSIRSGRDQFIHGEKMKWNLTKYTFPPKKISISVIITSQLNLKYIEVANNNLNNVFNVNWLLNTSSGLRPIHQNKYLNNRKIKLINSINETQENKLNSDFEFIIPAETILTEELIYKKIGTLLNISNTNGLDLFVGDIIDVSKKNIQNNSNGLVSVIVPTYKRNENFKHTLESLINQNYNSVEIIVVDDNGKDSHYSENVKAIINTCKGKHPIKYIAHQKNLNGAASRNTGILHAKGEYICFLDDDDIYLPGKIKKSVEALQNIDNEKVGGVYCGFLGWNSTTNDLNRYKKGNLTFELLSLNFSSHYLHTNTALYKKSSLIKINGFDESFQRHQDLELNLRFFEHFEMGVVKEILVELNPTPSEGSNKVFNDQMFRLKEKFLSRFQDTINKLTEKDRKIVYKKNWEETLRYFESKDHFINYCESRYELGYLNILQEAVVSKNKNIVTPIKREVDTENKVFIEKAKQPEQNNVTLKKEINNIVSNNNIVLESQIGRLENKINKLKNEKIWYSDTYDHLPKWYLKIGSVFRRIKFKKKF